MDTKLILIVTAVVVFFALEGVFPHYQGRKARVRRAIPHVLTAIINGFLMRLALAGVTINAIAWAEANSLGLFRWLSLPAPAALVLVLVLFEVWMYFWHMANHRIGFLWRFHRAHHSDIAMDTTTALRFHPGKLVLSTFIRLPVVILLGMRFLLLVVFEVLLNLSTLFHHSNLAVPEKWDLLLRMVMVTPNMHRVHHSVERDETDSNITSLLAFWDRLYGTFRTRENTRVITIGLPSFRETEYQRLWGFLITPLR